MSRYMLNGNEQFEDVVIGFDPMTDGFFLQCFWPGNYDEPDLWLPFVATLDELASAVSALELELPSLLVRLLSADFLKRRPAVYEGDYVYVVRDGMLSTRSYRVAAATGLLTDPPSAQVELEGGKVWFDQADVVIDEVQVLGTGAEHADHLVNSLASDECDPEVVERELIPSGRAASCSDLMRL